MNNLATIEYKNYTINVNLDEDPINPRENDNLGTMICFHKKYFLGDKHYYNQDNYNSWEELKKAIENENPNAIILPLYLYDHSGITMNTTGFYCKWDSGQVGWIYISREDIRKEYSCKRITGSLKNRVINYLIQEVKTYDQYLTGEIYGFSIDTIDEKNIDSCYGYDDKEYMIQEAKDMIDCRIKGMEDLIALREKIIKVNP